jgi:hypothetical protein
MGNGQWEMGNGQWAMGNGQWAMEVGNGQPKFYEHFPFCVAVLL